MNTLVLHLKNKSLSLFFRYQQFFTFLCVGVINTIFGYSVFASCIYVGLHYSTAVLVTTCAGIIFNFKTTGVLVFKNNNKKLFFKFILNAFIIYLLTVLSIKLINPFILNLYVSGAIVSAIMPIPAFLLNKRIFTVV